MKKFIAFLIISVLLTGCSLPFTISWNTPVPTASPEETAPAETLAPTEDATLPPATEVPPTALPFAGKEFNLGGVYMILPECMAADASGVIIPAAPYDEMGGPMEFYPANRKISFQGYPLSGNFFDPATSNHGGLTVYPVAEFVAMNPVIADRVNALQQLLVDQPSTPNGIAMLPVFNAAQVFKAQIKYLDFQNGKGVRFLTELAQYSAPVNNHDLFYAYQGLTNDGKYWVSAFFPVNTAYLQESPENPIVPPGGIPAPTFDDPNYSASMETYYTNMINLLNITPDANFTPVLSCLDQYIQSLNIGD